MLVYMYRFYIAHYYFNCHNYNKNSNIILTSATMRVDDSFDYFLNRNGLIECENIITKDYVSPFSYNDQVDYYQYGGTKDITGNPSKLSEIIYYIHKTFQKRTMVLFTSIKMLENVSNMIMQLCSWFVPSARTR